MAVKIKLKRMGKTRNPQYRIVIADSRTARGGRAIEEIGIYQPRQEPSLIQVDSERAQHWLGVGAQPTEPVLAILKVTGDWQRFKGLPGAEGTLVTAERKVDKQAVFEAAVKSAEAAGRAKARAPKPEAGVARAAGSGAAAPVEEAAPAAAEAPAAADVGADVPATAEVVAEVPATAEVAAEAPSDSAEETAKA
ncbi:MAG: 30S ribosomal protein S16 [Candidatus Nanopelagicales bacterium]